MERRKVLFSSGMTDSMIIITDAPKEALEKWCVNYWEEQENGVNTYFDTLRTMYYVKVLHDSEEDGRENVEVIGYDEEYNLDEYYNSREDNKIFIVFEYDEPTNKIIGVYANKTDAIKKHHENPTHRYIDPQILQ